MFWVETLSLVDFLTIPQVFVQVVLRQNWLGRKKKLLFLLFRLIEYSFFKITKFNFEKILQFQSLHWSLRFFEISLFSALLVSDMFLFGQVLKSCDSER